MNTVAATVPAKDMTYLDNFNDAMTATLAYIVFLFSLISMQDWTGFLPIFAATAAALVMAAQKVDLWIDGKRHRRRLMAIEEAALKSLLRRIETDKTLDKELLKELYDRLDKSRHIQ